MIQLTLPQRILTVALLCLCWISSCGLIQTSPNQPAPPRIFFRGTETLGGSLGPGDQLDLRDQTFVDLHTITGSADQVLRVAMESEDFDPYLEVVDPSDQVIAFDDDSGPDVNAYLLVALPQSGTYRIRATTFESQASGDYGLSYSLDPIRWNHNEIDELGPGDSQHPEDNSWMDVYTLQGQARRSLLISLSSYEFDAFLQLVNPQGQVIAFDDDQGRRSDALLAVYLEHSGPYQIRVNTYDPEGEGDYVMRYTLE